MNGNDDIVKLRNLAGRIAAADELDAEELDLLAQLATKVASALREALALRNAALMQRALAALDAFPQLAPLPEIRPDAAGESGIGEIERIAAEAKAAAVRLDAAKQALQAAYQAEDFDDIVRCGSEAKAAQTAVAASETDARSWVARYSIQPPTAAPAPEPTAEANAAAEPAEPAFDPSQPIVRPPTGGFFGRRVART